MVPTFPEFKHFELSDKEAIESFTKNFPPYSDFNFVSIYSWDVKSAMAFCQLNGNLVVRFTDYLTGSFFYSFLGNTKQNETAKELLDFAKKTGTLPQLKLMPGASVEGLDPDIFLIEEDPDSFDYLYDTEALSNLVGNKYLSRRGEVNRFLKKEYQYECREINIFENKEYILDLAHYWIDNKESPEAQRAARNEMFAINRLLSCDFEASALLTFGIFSHNKMIGFVVNEILPSGNSMLHFEKANHSFTGIHSFMIKENAALLHRKGVITMNYEQDLGIESLRKSKTSFRPSAFLKKSLVSYKQL
ncbi:MAG TPA: phosphatidylglycerol lysyltransferase domain-containing protein [Candidatus Paceibacterota bacterium]|nr:phosphatidylglycerol lysyltransferase domain-containing protein [Candidatus Paceibacterota bacterium]